MNAENLIPNIIEKKDIKNFEKKEVQKDLVFIFQNHTKCKDLKDFKNAKIIFVSFYPCARKIKNLAFFNAAKDYS